MRAYSISEAKNRLSALLARVRKGNRIVITDRGVPVAALVPLDDSGAPAATEGRLLRLERAGLIARRARPLAPELYQTPPPRAQGLASAALLAERLDGR